MKDEEYVGMFHFHFWRFGSWVDVIIDDELPTNGRRPAFGHCSENNEFWLPLMEKAYAKCGDILLTNDFCIRFYVQIAWVVRST